MRSPFKSENLFPFSSAKLDDEQKRLGDVLCAFQRGDTKRREKISGVFLFRVLFFEFFFFCVKKKCTHGCIVCAQTHTQTNTQTQTALMKADADIVRTFYYYY